MIKADNLVKVFAKTEKKNKKTEINAVDGISLTVQEGEIAGILGPNGAGKTTLLRMLSKIMKPTSGKVSIQVNGQEITDEAEMKRHIGYLSNNTKLYCRLSVRELLEMLGKLYGLSDEQVKKRLNEIIQILAMESFADNRIERLSTGQTQRASIARCLVHDPQIYIFDEPTLGLDIISSSSIIEFMKQEQKKGKTILYSTHYMEEAEYLCNRIVMLHNGRILKEGTPDMLKKEMGKENLREVFWKLISAEEESLNEC